MTKLYVRSKIEAYNVAIGSLQAHESADEEDRDLVAKLCEKLADRLDREIQRWCNSLPDHLLETEV